MSHNFQQIIGTQHAVHRCIFCGVFPMERMQEACNEEQRILGTTVMPSQIARFTEFTIAKARHLMRGSPELTVEQISKRFSHCSVCPHYNPSAGVCALCGCLVNLNAANEGWNALAWADKECPDNPPRFQKLA